ncbi:MAG: ribonuclease P protein component [Anaerolineae bacterium]|nr:ribonuclease P protein component [Anaerolineae bacterium]
MKRAFRLTRSTDFERVRRSGKSYPHPLLVLVACPNPGGEVRVGVVAGRSVGCAVKRNRAKRLLRASMDSLVAELKPGFDILLLSRGPLPEAGYQKTRATLEALLRRAKLVSEPNGTEQS